MAVYAAVALGVTAAVFFVHLRWSHRKLLRTIEAGDLPVRPAASPSTEAFEHRVDQLSTLGFERVGQEVELDLAGDIQRLAMLWRVDGAMAEISQPATRAGAVKLTVFTILEPGSGLLATQDVYGFLTLGTELKQVFHHADPTELVREHERAVAWLAPLGLTPRIAPRDRTFEIYVRWIQRAAVQHPRSFALFLRLMVSELRDRVYDDAGSIIDAEGTRAKVDAIRGTAGDPLWEVGP